MKNGPVLITSFRPWRVHQRSNSSNDLVAELHAGGRLPVDTVWLAQVPVNFAIAPIRVISEIARLRPRVVICCGMAENRAVLSIERQATGRQSEKRQVKELHEKRSMRPANLPPLTLQTSVKVSALLSGTLLSEPSDDAGSYVCNHLYYRVLKFIDQTNWPTRAIFIHIPLLTAHNKRLILDDFVAIASQLAEQT
jgi:pyroglutamyl-peptidase